MELDDYRWLVSEAATPWLDRARTDTRPTLQIASALRKDLSQERTHLVLELTELRARARAKFLCPENMFFTRKGLEQSTDIWVARYKAARYGAEAPLADLCCGIGGDLLAMAERGPVTAVDKDPVAALLAEANVSVTEGLHAVRVVAAGVETVRLADVAHWHIDPDRRPHGKRVTGLDFIEPSLAVLTALLNENPNGTIKLAPATALSEQEDLPARPEWISRDGECRQLVAWCGAGEDSHGPRTATVLDRTGNVLRSVCGESQYVPTGPPGRYVYEPDAAILAAKLEGQIAADLQFQSLGGGYLTGDELVVDSGLQAFEVHDAMPFDRKRISAWLAERGIGDVEVKSRDGRSDANRLQREFRSKGTQQATILLAPMGKKTLAVLAHRAPTTSVS